MTRLLACIAAAALLAGSADANAAGPERLRGTLETVTADAATLQGAGGTTQSIATTPATTYALVSKSSLGAILPGSFIGTAAKGSGPGMVALEVVVFPPSMRGAGEGHYPWDPLPDVARTKTMTASSMTNGSVMSVMPQPKVDSSMTNGSVQTVSTLLGAKQISVVYNGGKQIITVLPGTPVVTVSMAAREVLKPGAHVFIVATDTGGKLSALRIIVGAGGMTPPM